jgi:hypothetical protein
MGTLLWRNGNADCDPAGADGASHPYDLTGEAHAHDFAEIAITQSGRAEHHVASDHVPVSASDVFLIR